MFNTYHSNSILIFFFFFNDTATTEIYTLSLHDALPVVALVLRVVVLHQERRSLDSVVIALFRAISRGHISPDDRLRRFARSLAGPPEKELVARTLPHRLHAFGRHLRRHVAGVLTNQLQQRVELPVVHLRRRQALGIAVELGSHGG